MEIQRSKRSNLTTTAANDGDVPGWLWFEVFLRLPLHSVFTCRFISKLWLSIASDPSFIRAYTSRTRPYWTVLSPYTLSRISDPSLLNNVVPREIYLRPHLYEMCLPSHEAPCDCIVIGVSNGLVLYYSLRYLMSADLYLSNLYICNPVTGRWIKACDEPIGLPRDVIRRSWGFLTRVDEELVLKSYRIVEALEPEKEPNVVVFKVYYSEMDEWKKFTVALRLGPYKLNLQASAAVLKGLLHWADVSLGLIVYDPEENPERARVICRPLDAARPHDTPCSCWCTEYRGELRYIRGYLTGHPCEFPRFSIWGLEDYDAGEWCLLHRIEIDTPMYYSITIDDAFFDPCDPDVVFCVAKGFRRRYVYSYNLKSGEFDERRDMIVDDRPFRLPFGKPLRWTLLLVIPWPTRVSEEHLDRRRIT